MRKFCEKMRIFCEKKMRKCLGKYWEIIDYDIIKPLMLSSQCREISRESLRNTNEIFVHISFRLLKTLVTLEMFFRGKKFWKWFEIIMKNKK